MISTSAVLVRHLTITTAACALLLPLTSGAQLIFEESFSIPANPFVGEGSPYQEWEVYYHGTPTIPLIVDGNGLRFHRPSGSGTAVDNAVAFWSGNAEFTNGRLQDYAVTVTTRFQGGVASGATSVAGIILGAQDKSYGDSKGYYVAYGNRGTTFGIYDNPISHSNIGVPVAEAVLTTPLTEATEYILNISYVGSVISARLDDMSGNTLAQVSYASARDSDGYLGLRSAYPNTNVSNWFKDMEVIAIPEPNAAVSLLSLIIGLYVYMRHRRRA